MTLQLKAKQSVAPDTISFIFESQEPLKWQAGQYVLYRLPHANPDDRKDRRFFTNSAAPFEKVTRITTRFNPKSSSFKRALRQLEPGDTIEAVKVAGDFVMDDPRGQHVFIAGGIGITPYRSILKQLDHDGQPINVILLYANRTTDFVFKPELEELAAKHPGLKVYYFVDPEKIDAGTIKKTVPSLNQPIFWLSGPEPMVEAFEKMLDSLGVPTAHVKTDFFPGYNWPET